MRRIVVVVLIVSLLLAIVGCTAVIGSKLIKPTNSRTQNPEKTIITANENELVKLRKEVSFIQSAPREPTKNEATDDISAHIKQAENSKTTLEKEIQNSNISNNTISKQKEANNKDPNAILNKQNKPKPKLQRETDDKQQKLSADKPIGNNSSKEPSKKAPEGEVKRVDPKPKESAKCPKKEEPKAEKPKKDIPKKDELKPKKASYSIDDIEKTMWVTGSLNLRKDPSTNNKPISVLSTGTKVKATGKVSNGWYRVAVSGKSGYVSGKYLSNNKVEMPKKKSPSKGSYKANTIYLMGRSVKYKNGGMKKCQSIIDGNKNLASTFGGVEKFSGTDDKNTHFAAHKNGAFKGLWNMKKGAEVVVTDGNGTPFTYAINSIQIADEFGQKKNGEYIHLEILGTGGGERIVLQTCSPKEKGMNYFIFAKLK